MIYLDAATTVGLVLIAVVAAFFDIRERRVPNVLTVGGLATALLLGAAGGWDGLGAAAAGALISLLVALPIFLSAVSAGATSNCSWPPVRF